MSGKNSTPVQGFNSSLHKELEHSLKRPSDPTNDQNRIQNYYGQTPNSVSVTTIPKLTVSSKFYVFLNQCLFPKQK